MTTPRTRTLLPGLLLVLGALALPERLVSVATAGDAAVPPRDASAGRVVAYDPVTRAERVLPATRSGGDRARRRAARPNPDRRAVEEPLLGAAGPRGKVFGADDRFPVADPTAYPWSAVCKVFSRFPSGDLVEGSAVLVGDRFALTAGHLVYERAFGGFADSVEVIPAYDYGDLPFGSYLADDITTFAGWTDSQDFDWDVALVRLDGAPGDDAGWLGISAARDSDLIGSTVNTGGYPGDLDFGEAMWGATGVLDALDLRQLLLRGELDASRGQSGSGVWQRRADGRYVVGVLATETSTYNRAVRITDAVFDAIDLAMDTALLPDMAVTAVSASAPAEFAVPFASSVQVTVRNDGAVGAATGVSVFARDVFGARTLLGRANRYVAPGAAASVAVPIDVPSTLGGATYEFVAEANADRAFDEPDFADNVLAGPRFTALGAFETLSFRGTAWRFLDPGDVVRFRMEVPADFALLKLALAGSRGAFATVRRPDGSSFTVLAGAASTAFEHDPLGGVYEVVLRLPEDAHRGRWLRLRTSLR